jgi:galactokinase
MGSRLTGAGWGGCTVSIVPDNQVGEFIAKIKERYYLKKFPALKENSQEMDNYIFASKPGLGAAIFSEVSNF